MDPRVKRIQEIDATLDDLPPGDERLALLDELETLTAWMLAEPQPAGEPHSPEADMS